MNNKIKISVIIPTYNSSKTILSTLNSVLNQSYKNIEIIVVDDGSNDNTIEIVKEIKNEKIVIINKIVNSGVSSSRNIGVENANGEIIAFIDSDDLWLEYFLEDTLNCMLNKNVDLCGSRIIKDNGINRSVVGASTIEVNEKNIDIDYLDIACYEPVFSMSSILVKKNAFIQHGGFNINSYSGEDHEFYAKISINGKFGLCNKILAIYNIIPNKKRRKLCYPPIIKYLEKNYTKFDIRRREKVINVINKFKLNYVNSLIINNRGKEARKFLKENKGIVDITSLKKKYYIFFIITIFPNKISKNFIYILLILQKKYRRYKFG